MLQVDKSYLLFCSPPGTENVFYR